MVEIGAGEGSPQVELIPGGSALEATECVLVKIHRETEDVVGRGGMMSWQWTATSPLWAGSAHRVIGEAGEDVSDRDLLADGRVVQALPFRRLNPLILGSMSHLW